MYKVGQYFKQVGKGDLYILANVGQYITLIGIKSGNRWADSPQTHEFKDKFKVNKKDWKVVTHNQRKKFIPVNVKTILAPDWEV